MAIENFLRRQITSSDNLFLELQGPDMQKQWRFECSQERQIKRDENDRGTSQILDSLGVVTGSLQEESEKIADELVQAMEKIYKKFCSQKPQKYFPLQNIQIQKFIKKFERKPISSRAIQEAAKDILAFQAKSRRPRVWRPRILQRRPQAPRSPVAPERPERPPLSPV